MGSRSRSRSRRPRTHSAPPAWGGVRGTLGRARGDLARARRDRPPVVSPTSTWNDADPLGLDTLPPTGHPVADPQAQRSEYQRQWALEIQRSPGREEAPWADDEEEARAEAQAVYSDTCGCDDCETLHEEGYTKARPPTSTRSKARPPTSSI